MSFEGREELVNNCIDYFEKYADDFIDNVKNLYKQDGKTLTQECKNAYEELYLMLLTKNFDVEAGKKIAETNGFSKVYFLELLIEHFVDFARYINKNNLNHKMTTYFAFAIERYNEIFSKIYRNNTEVENTINVFSASSSSGFFIHEDFMDTFRKIERAGETLEFLNLYNGVPVRTFGEILKVEDDNMVVKVDLMQILAMKEEDCAYIVQNQYLHKNLKANILSVNITNSTVTLNNFETQPYMHALKRAYPRVHPNEFTKIALQHEDGRVVNGKLFDISEGGIGVLSMEDVGFKSGDILSSNINLHMPETNENVNLNLKFKLVVLIVYQNAYRYCLEVLPNQEDTAKIQEFAVKRVQETLVELKDQLKLYQRD